MITAINNGYVIEYINDKWVQQDTKESADIIRPCKYCGKLPSKEGYDGCIGFLPNVKYACCGHDIIKPYVIFNDGRTLEFKNIDELKKYFNN